MKKYVLFTEIPLLIIVSGVVINNWKAVNKGVVVEKIINVVLI